MEDKFRVRDKNLHVMLTEYELQQIKAKKEAAGIETMREYVLESTINGYVINVDYTELKNLTYEINKIGTNINQIAHRINSEGKVYQTEIDEVKDNVERIWHLLRSKFYQLS